MKIRIRDNSIRLRLSRGEVDILMERGSIKSTTGFPDGEYFLYSVESSPASVHPTANFAKGEMCVRLPEKTVAEWATSDSISIAGDQLIDDGKTLSILVEKDFACLAPRDGEDESDMFPHPEQGNANC